MMSLAECNERIKQLQLAYKVYGYLYKDMRSTFYKCPLVRKLHDRTKEELNRLEDCREAGDFNEQ